MIQSGEKGEAVHNLIVTEIVSVARLTIKALICGAALHNLGRHMMDERTLTVGHNPGHHEAVGCDLISNSV